MRQTGAVSIRPDTKDWTWVLERPCPECGFDPSAVEVTDLPALIHANTRGWYGALDGGDAGVRPDPSTWSRLEYACHVRDVLLVQRERVILARWVETPELAPMARDLRAGFDGYADQEPAAVARQLTDAALLFGNVLDRLDEQAWDRTLIYNFPEPRERSLRWVAAHTLHELRHHLMDARRLL